MANVFATKSGNWSDTTVWNTGALPTTADDVFANNFVVNVNVSATVLTVRTTSGTGINAGGSFELQNGVTLTCTATIGVLQGTTTAVVFSLASPNSATLNAGLSAGRSGASAGTSQVLLSGTGTLNTNGTIFAVTSSVSSSNAIIVSGIGAVLNHTGNVTGSENGISAQSNAIFISGATSTVNITGDLQNRTQGSGAGNSPIRHTVNCFINVTGNLYWTINNSNSTRSVIDSGGGSATVTITGNVTGADAVTSNALLAVTGTITVIGTVTGGQTGLAISQNSLFVTGPLIQSASTVHPISSANWRWHSALTPTYYAIRNSANTAYRNLWTSDNPSSGAGQPATNNVRSGTVYGPTNEYTGTLAVPAAGSVALGVAVDNTTGTAILTAANVRTAVGLASANLDAQLAAIPTTPAPTAADIRTEMDANSTKLANLDATISSRLADSSYQAPLDAAGTRSAVGLSSANLDTQLAALPSAVDVRTEMDANSTKLANLDATISSRLAPSGTLARVTLVDTTTTLTNAPDVPTESEIADAVRTELAPELDRIGNTATTQEVSDIVEGAMQLPE